MVSGKPEPSLIRSPQDAEASACTWMRYWGYSDAQLTGDGADGGVDVRSARAVAQVKAEMKPTTRPTVQQLAGIASYENAEPIFFSLAGFTDQAAAWATDAGIALFSFDLSGEPEPLNAKAHSIATSVGSELIGVAELKDLIRQGIERQDNFTIFARLRSASASDWDPDNHPLWSFGGSVPGGAPPPDGWKMESWLFSVRLSGIGHGGDWYSYPGYGAEDMVHTLIRILRDCDYEADDFAFSLV